MTARLEVWVRHDADLAIQHQGLWYVTVLQNDGSPLTFEGNAQTYLNGLARFGHWAAAVPPGFYVVVAQRWLAGGKRQETNRAVVQVGCHDDVCVLLRPVSERNRDTPLLAPPGKAPGGADDGRPDPTPEPPATCTVEVTGVVGRSSDGAQPSPSLSPGRRRAVHASPCP